jgi:hypothetical protein
MPLVNASPFQAVDLPWVDASGNAVVIAIVKGTFVVGKDGGTSRAEEPTELRPDDVPLDPDNPNSSARYPSDMGDCKVGTDVVVVGDAVATKKTKVMDVAIRIRETVVPLRVHGERVFYKGMGGVAVGPALEFERVPIVYERAYGGSSDDLSVVELRNPAGRGVAKNPSDLVDKPAPQIEHPAYPHTSAKDRHPPVGFGSLRSHWGPRRDYVGTVDEEWKANRMPLMPRDFDPRYYNVAHPSLQFDPPLAAGEAIAIMGMSEALFRFELPSLRLCVRGRFDVAGTVEVRPHVDTVLVDPRTRRVDVVSRVSFKLGRGRNVLREIQVDTDE